MTGVSADKFEHISREELDTFKKFVSETMEEVLSTPDKPGKGMKDQKDSDILISNTKSGIQLLPVDFGEYGMYKLFDEAANQYAQRYDAEDEEETSHTSGL